MIRPAVTERKASRRRLGQLWRPWLETLEARLPPDDTLLGLLVAGDLLDEPFLDSSFILRPSSFASDSVANTVATWPRTFNDISLSSQANSNESVEYLATWPGVHRVAPPCASQCMSVPLSTDTAPVRASSRGSVPSSVSMPSRPGIATVSDQRPAGLIPAVYPAGINPAAHQGRISGPTTAIFPSAFPNGSSGTRAAEANYGSLPFYFEQNVGQADEAFDFVARGQGYTLGLSATEAIFSIQNSEFRIQNPESMSDWASVDASARHDRPTQPSDPAHVGLTARRSPDFLVRMQIVGANPDAGAVRLGGLSTRINYFLGNDPNQWHTNVPTFGKVQYDEVYPGIDLIYYATPPSPAAGRGDGGEGANLEYDFIVSPGADPNQIQLTFSGADNVEIDAAGNLVLQTGDTELRQQKPYLYQEVTGTRQQVAGAFRIQNSEFGIRNQQLETQNSNLKTQNSTNVTFDVGAYDASRPLVIDPLVLSYSTYLGGAFYDIGRDVVVDAMGNAYVTGSTASPNFPVTPGAFDTTHSGQTMVFVAKLNANGSGLVYATFLGGPSTSFPYAIAVDAAGQAYVTGLTGAGFPTTSGAFDTSYNGNTDGFVAKLNATGSGLVYSTYLGGTSFDDGHGIAVDVGGSAYVSGSTKSTDFPTTPGAFDTSFNGGVYDAFAVKLTGDGSGLAYSTFVGGLKSDNGSGISVDSAGNAYLTGGTLSFDFPTTPDAYDTTYNVDVDGFVTKLSADGSILIYSTFFGGRSRDGIAQIILAPAGDAYLTGNTRSANFPTTQGAFDTTFNGEVAAFVSKLSADGNTLIYSTYLGGNYDGGQGLAVDGAGNIYVTGFTPGGFPITPGAFDTTYNGGVYDSFLAILNPAGSRLTCSTYLGGRGTDYGSGVAVVGTGDVYVTGYTGSPNFPKTAGAFDTTYNGATDAFVMKFRVRSRDPLKVNWMIP